MGRRVTARTLFGCAMKLLYVAWLLARDRYGEKGRDDMAQVLLILHRLDPAVGRMVYTWVL